MGSVRLVDLRVHSLLHCGNGCPFTGIRYLWYLTWYSVPRSTPTFHHSSHTPAEASPNRNYRIEVVNSSTCSRDHHLSGEREFSSLFATPHTRSLASTKNFTRCKQGAKNPQLCSPSLSVSPPKILRPHDAVVICPPAFALHRLTIIASLSW